jgi:carbon storage regulator
MSGANGPLPDCEILTRVTQLTGSFILSGAALNRGIPAWSDVVSRRLSMLVLTRRTGEQLVIDEDIVVTVLSVEGDRIRLGISAPPSIRVDRQEVHERRQVEKACALPANPKTACASNGICKH